MKLLKERRGFTMLEVIVSLCIISVLVIFVVYYFESLSATTEMSSEVNQLGEERNEIVDEINLAFSSPDSDPIIVKPLEHMTKTDYEYLLGFFEVPAHSGSGSFNFNELTLPYDDDDSDDIDAFDLTEIVIRDSLGNNKYPDYKIEIISLDVPKPVEDYRDPSLTGPPIIIDVKIKISYLGTETTVPPMEFNTFVKVGG